MERKVIPAEVTFNLVDMHFAVMRKPFITVPIFSNVYPVETAQSRTEKGECNQ